MLLNYKGTVSPFAGDRDPYWKCNAGWLAYTDP